MIVETYNDKRNIADFTNLPGRLRQPRNQRFPVKLLDCVIPFHRIVTRTIVPVNSRASVSFPSMSMQPVPCWINRKVGQTLKPHITLITLGVQDLQRSLEFYRDGLGLPTNGIIGEEFEDGAVAFFTLDGGLVLALYPRYALNKDADLDTTEPVESQSSVGFSLAHNVGSKEEVDQVMQQAASAGATIAKAAYDRVWGGYTGYFRDPDGHLWEVAWNPGGFGD